MNPDETAVRLNELRAMFPADMNPDGTYTVAGDALDSWLVEQSKWMPEACVMVHEDPYDFAYCETHDNAFALGAECEFNGRVLWERWAEVADEQRGLKVHAEMELEYLQGVISQVRSLLSQPDAVSALKVLMDSIPE